MCESLGVARGDGQAWTWLIHNISTLPVFFWFLRCWNVIHYILFRKFIIQLLNSGLKNAWKIIRILYSLSNAVIGNKFAKFQCFDKEMWPTACFSHSIKTKCQKWKKSKKWKFSINTVKNVSTASHKLPHFFSEHVFTLKKLNTKSLELLSWYFWKQGEKNLEGSEFHLQLKWS